MSSAGSQPAQGRQDGGATMRCSVDLRSTIRRSETAATEN
jgi:hypothetical protein